MVSCVQQLCLLHLAGCLHGSCWVACAAGGVLLAGLVGVLLISRVEKHCLQRVLAKVLCGCSTDGQSMCMQAVA